MPQNSSVTWLYLAARTQRLAKSSLLEESAKQSEALPSAGGVPADLGQRFTVVLSDNPAATSDAWVRIQVEMFALYSRRIAGHIGARRVSGFGPPVPAVGVPWRLDPPNTALLGAPRRHGATDAEGSASFWVRGFGDYVLTFVVDGCEWEVPLAVRPDPEKDR